MPEAAKWPNEHIIRTHTIDAPAHAIAWDPDQADENGQVDPGGFPVVSPDYRDRSLQTLEGTVNSSK